MGDDLGFIHMYNFYAVDWHYCFFKDLSQLEVQLNLDEDDTLEEAVDDKKVEAKVSENADPQAKSKKMGGLAMKRLAKLQTVAKTSVHHNYG